MSVAGLDDLISQLWEGADELRANSKLSATEYSRPVLGLIFLKFADYRFQSAKEHIESRRTSSRREIKESDYQALGGDVPPEESRWSTLQTFQKKQILVVY